MVICISNILEPQTLQALREALAPRILFEDGVVSAGAGAAVVKANLQGRADAAVIRGACEKIRSSLLEHEVVRTAALPTAVARVLINRYEADMGYGWHSDEPFIENVRTDLSFTVFLSDPASYEGGALEITSSAGTEVIKLDAGSVLLYSSGDLHQVQTVTSGIRLAAVGWLQSRIRSSEQRTLQFELANTLSSLPAAERTAAMELAAIRHKLVRMWSDSTPK
ncbi:MAG: Fe2+-dependent dioxygenase [Pseudomonadales bacterium]